MIRTDNVSPFATPAPCGLSRLSIWWLKMGILHERIDPGRPQQNGSHERMHRTLKAETAKPPGPSLVAQQRRFDAFVEVFNNERPHEAIGMKTPSCLYSNSGRVMPRCTPAFEYDSGIEIRRVHQSGRIRFKNGSLILLGRALAGEDVALKEAEDGIWRVYLGPLLGAGRALLRCRTHSTDSTSSPKQSAPLALTSVTYVLVEICYRSFHLHMKQAITLG